MADRIVKSDISVKDPAGDYISSLGKAIEITDKFKRRQLQLLEANKKIITQYKQPTNIKEVKALSTAVSEQKKGVDNLNTVRKAQLQIDKELKTARAQEIRQAKQQAKEVKEVEKAVAKFNKEQKKAKKLSDDNANAFKRLTKKTNEAQAEFKRLAAQYGVTSTQARKAELTFRKLDDRLRKINNTARDGRRDVGRYGLAFQKVGNLLRGGLGALGLAAGVAGLSRVIGSSIGIFSGFAKANSNLQAILGDAGTKGNMDLLKESAKELGATTAFTASEVAGLQIEFAKLGFDPKEIDNATGSTLALAAAAGTELAEAASVVGATLGGFGLGAEETARVTDVMAKSFSTSALDMEKFKESMKSAAPAAKAVGISVEKTTALLGTLANAGISGSKAGNNLKTSLINLNAAGLTLDEGLKQVSESQDKLGAATKLVGKNAAASFLVLADGTETIASLEEGLNNAAGAAQKMADIQLDNLAGDVTILGSAWEGFILSVESGEGALNNFLRQAVQMATGILGVLSGVTDLSDEFFKLKEETDSLESSMVPLLDRHDELAEKTELSVEEQTELDEIILKVAEDIPTAITAFDEYGKAMGISTEAARKFIEQQKRLLILKNTEAIEEQQNEIAILSRQLTAIGSEYEFVNGVLRRNIQIIGRRGETVKLQRDANAEEIKQLQEKKLLIRTEIDDRNAIIAVLRGEKSALELLAEAEDKENESKKEGVEVAEKEVEVIRDRIKLLQEQIKVQNALELRSDEDIALRNITIEGINEEIRRLRALGLEKDKQAGILELEPIKDIDDELEADRKLFEAKNKLIQDELEAERQLQLDLDAINDAKFNSTKNLTELLSGLAKEGTREAELLIRLKKTLAITEIAIDLQAEIAAIRKNNAGKDNQTEINTAQIFEATTVAALGVAGVISAFEGMDDTGIVAQPLDSNGGRLMNIHNNEQIWSKKNVKDGGGRTRDESIGILQSFDQGLLMSPHAFKSLEMGNVVNSSDVNLKGFENAVNAQTAQLDSSMKKNAVHVEVGFNNIGEFFKKMKKEGTTRITTAKGDGGFL